MFEELRLPLVGGRVEAGFPSPADDFIERSLDLNEQLVSNPIATFFMRANGNSMDGAGIHDGDLLIVDKSLNPKNFSTVIVNINEELVVKTFVRENNKSFLTSGSKKIEYKINLIENPEILIWGVVTYVIHAL